MNKEKQSALNVIMTNPKKSCDGGCKCANVSVHDIESPDIKSLEISYDTRNTVFLSIDGALIDISEGGEARILFYSSPLLKEPGVSIVRCPVEVRLKKSVLLSFVEDLLNQTNTYLKEETEKMDMAPKKWPPEVMFR
ncbi:Uncharacterised protein [uncultured archaeon]|nr:Uncharacterised protein [uncultured archaeon]